MKKIIVILLAILSISCQAQQKNDMMNQDKVKFYPKDLVYIKSIPQQKEILSIALKKDDVSSNTALKVSLFKNALDHNNTRILNPNNKLDDKLLSGYSYSPWYVVEFTTVKGNYKITLFLGGLGFVTLPNGKRGAILFDLSDLKIKEDEKLLSYYKKIKRKVLSTRTGDEDVEEIELKLEGKIITYTLGDDAIKINNMYPHPSKEFNENIYIHQYVIKVGNSKVYFRKGDTQILETDKAYTKLVVDFINTTESLTTQYGIYNIQVKLMKDNILVFPDGLKIELSGFSHKRTFDNEESTVIAGLEISENQSKESSNFSIRRSEDKDDQGNLITTYESKEWEKYNIELTSLSYDKSIDIIVSKIGDTNLDKRVIEITNELSMDEFELIKNFILKNKGRQTYRNYDNNNPHYAFIDFDIYLGADIGRKNSNNDPDISDFNELTIKHTILGAPIKYFQLVIVRKSDLVKDKAHIMKGMEENKVYLVDLDNGGLDKLKKRLPPFLKTIRERIANSK